MDEFKEKMTGLLKLIKAPKYFYVGIAILLIIFLFLPVLKLLAIIVAIIFIFIGFFPDNAISQQITDLINRFKNW